MTQYTIQEFKNIIYTGFAYKLPPDTMTAIKELCVEMGVLPPTKIRDFSIETTAATAAAVGANSNFRGYRPRTHGDEWETVRGGGGGGGGAAGAPAFKATKIEKTEGFDKKITDIRICLNKVSSKNVEAQYILLLELVRSVFDCYDLESDEVKRTVTAILEISYLNKFYSSIYALIYSRIATLYPVFLQKLLEYYFTSFLPSFENIIYIDPNGPKGDYDGFCKYNKENDTRKSIAMFCVNLMKLGHFEKTNIIQCIQTLLDYINRYIEEENRTNEVEEITENIFLLITNTTAELSGLPAWDEIMERIQELSVMKHTSKPSITNRAIFKYMDLMEL
jgi:hypothetical protein